MKNILAILFLFVTVKAHVWPEHNSHAQSRPPAFPMNLGYNYGRPHNHFHNFNWHQRRNDFMEPSYNNADWVCRNPKTGDMMIITSDNSMDRPTSGQHWHANPYDQSQHYPTGQTEHYPWTNRNPNENPNENPIQNPNGPEENNHNLDNVNIDVTVPTTIGDTNNNDNEATKYHGGEGLIDVRIGE